MAPLEVKVLRARLRPARKVETGPYDRAGRDPGHRPEWRPDARIVIEDVWPEVDCGRYPIKRVVGDEVAVWADLLRDGHDQIAAVLKYGSRTRSGGRRRSRCSTTTAGPARFRPDRVGRWRYTIEAWTDRFDSWRADVAKKRDAGQDIALELVEGEHLVEAAIRACRGGAMPQRLRAICDELAAADAARRAELMLSDELRALMARADDRADRVRYERELEVVVDRPEARFAAWYEMFPRSQGRDSGQERHLRRHDRAAAARSPGSASMSSISCRSTRSAGSTARGATTAPWPSPAIPGSPYAIGAEEGGQCAVHPELGTLEDFRRFVAAAAGLGMEIALDFAIQCAPDHPWVREHKEWFNFRPDGSIKYAENPPKKYEDIVNVDFYNPDREGLWTRIARHRCCSGSTRGCASSGSTTRTPSRCRSGNG